jgi:beta-barrel assembly-enhancing protease
MYMLNHSWHFRGFSLRKVLTCLTAATTLVGSSLLSPVATVAQTPAQNSHPTFVRAKRDLKPELYTMYRIVDLLARANGLTTTAWRVRILPEYNINAFAIEANLIGVHTGLLDSFYADNDALACVIAHEKAHHTRRHMAVGNAQTQALVEQGKKEDEQRERNLQDKTRRNTLLNIFVAPGVGTVLQGSDQRNADKAAREAEAKRKAELAALSRQQELEADELGYVYMARAGFNPQGCMRVFEVLGRMPTAEIDTSHPSVPARMQAMQELMTKMPVLPLRREGALSLARIQPLTYGMSTDGQSLRINSSIVTTPGGGGIQF